MVEKNMKKTFKQYQVEKQCFQQLDYVYKRKLNFMPFIEQMQTFDENKILLMKDLLIEGQLEAVQNAVANRLFSYEDIVLFYLIRIKNYDEKYNNSIMEINPHVLELARFADENRPENPSAIYGIPIMVKDNISTGFDMHNSAGSYILRDSQPKIVSPIIDRITALGGIILGKSNMSEWAFYLSSKGVSGYSALGGQCHNPYGLLDVGGSSSGSAVSVSSNFCMLSLGTETNGSITNPSSQNSIVGIYPTRGSWPNKHIIPISENLDTAGPMARTVEDAAILLGLVADNDYCKDMKKAPLKIKIGVIANLEMIKKRQIGDDKIVAQIEKEFQMLGIDIHDILIEDEAFEIDMDLVLEFEANHSIDNYLNGIESESIKSLEEIVEIYEKSPESVAPYGYDLLKESVQSKITYDDNMDLFLKNQNKAQKIIDNALKEVDMLLTLSSQFSTIYCSAGYPSINIPIGYRTNGEPLGMTLTASRNEESKLIQMAYYYQSHFNKRIEPIYFKGVDKDEKV